MPKKKSAKTIKEKSTEIFEVKKDNKEKVVQEEITEDVPVAKKGQLDHQNKILKIILFSSILIIAIVFGAYYYIDSLKSQDYKGVEYKTTVHGDLIFYQTSIPVLYQGKMVPYNFYLRTKINKLTKIPFDDENYKLMKFAVLNFTDTFDCNDGDEIIAVANLRNVHDVLGIQIMYDSEASCDPDGRYSYYNLMESDETKIEKIGEQCYNIHVANCEILPATEKVIAEMLYEYQLS